MNNLKHVITINSREILVCDYCLSRLANSYFNQSINNSNNRFIDRKEMFLLALHYSRMVYNKQNLDNRLVKAISLPYTTVYYYIQNGQFEKLLAKLSL